jgi:pyrrolysine biosynthesis protein PylC
MAVYHATGINLVQALAGIFIPLDPRVHQPSTKRFVILEHLQVSGKALTVAGEHIMKQHGLQVQKNFFGADEAITNYARGKKTWVATLIISAPHAAAVQEKRQQVLKTIQALALNTGRSEDNGH